MEVIGILDYLVGFAIVAGIYSVFSLGLNVHWGFTGLFNIGIAGFFALGAYTSALLTTSSPDPALFEDFKFGGNWASLGYLDWGIDAWFVFGLAAAALCCGVIALVIGYVTLRLRGDYLAIATLGIAETVRLVFLNEKWLANGSKGLYRIPKFLGRLDNAGQLQLPVRGGGGPRAGSAIPGCAAGGQLPMGTGAAGHQGGRDGCRGQRQGRIQIQAPGVHHGRDDHGRRRCALRSPHPLSLSADIRPAAGHIRHLGHADGGRLCQQ